jgi:hypothetical protein
MKDLAELQQQVGADQLPAVIQRTARPVRFDHAVASRYEGAGDAPLPPIVDIMDFLDKPLPKPPELINGVFHKGTKLILSGASKSRKTWALAHLGVCVAAGLPWWGFNTARGKVLYANFEILPAFFQERIQSIKDKIFLEGTRLKGQFHLWNLRGHAADISKLADKIIERAQEQYDLIILDPIYKVLGDRDENSNGQMAGLMNEIDRIVEATGAGAAFAHHFSKGNQAKKNAMDRMSGAGVFARDADSLLSMTDHQSPDTYVINAILRNHRPVEPFCVTLDHPIMERWEGADPTNLKAANPPQKKCFVADLIKLFEGQELRRTELKQQFLAAKIGSDGTFNNLFREARDNGAIEECDHGRKWRATPPAIMANDEGNHQAEEKGGMVQ